MGAFIDLTGQKFGKLTVLRNLTKRTKNNSGPTVWLCQCDCGIVKNIRYSGLVRGSSSSCGSHTCRPNFKDLTGQKFERLTVIKMSTKKGKRGSAYWECVCDCGNLVTIFGASMSCGKTRSCGCVKHSKQYETIKNLHYRMHLIHAKENNVVSYLSKEEYVQIASQRCHYCNLIDIKKNNRTKVTIELNGVDRKNNELYYKIENALPCCKNCNFMKRNTPYGIFVSSIKSIYLNIFKKDLEDKKESDQ